MYLSYVSIISDDVASPSYISKGDDSSSLHIMNDKGRARGERKRGKASERPAGLSEEFGVFHDQGQFAS